MDGGWNCKVVMKRTAWAIMPGGVSEEGVEGADRQEKRCRRMTAWLPSTEHRLSSQAARPSPLTLRFRQASHPNLGVSLQYYPLPKKAWVVLFTSSHRLQPTICTPKKSIQIDVFLKNLFIFKGINKKLNILTKKVTIYKWAQLQCWQIYFLHSMWLWVSFNHISIVQLFKLIIPLKYLFI